MLKDPVFRGCTRPPMFLGVPHAPFFMGAGGCLLLALYFNLLFLLLVPVVIAVMRQMTRRDDMIFRLLALNLRLRLLARNRGQRGGLVSFSPGAQRPLPRPSRQ